MHTLQTLRRAYVGLEVPGRSWSATRHRSAARVPSGGGVREAVGVVALIPASCLQRRLGARTAHDGKRLGPCCAAGVDDPGPAHDASRPQSPRSTSETLKPICARRSAVGYPTTLPPITTTSLLESEMAIVFAAAS